MMFKSLIFLGLLFGSLFSNAAIIEKSYCGKIVNVTTGDDYHFSWNLLYMRDRSGKSMKINDESFFIDLDQKVDLDNSLQEYAFSDLDIKNENIFVCLDAYSPYTREYMGKIYFYSGVVYKYRIWKNGKLAYKNY